MPPRAFMAILVGLASLGGTIAQTNPSTAPTGTETFDGQIVETTGPLMYYVSKCARCHGQAENSYTERPVPQRGDALRQVIQQMAEGPAMSPLEKPQLQEQLDMHLAILEKLPYAWIAPARDKVLSGEIIPGSEVTLTADKRIIKAKIDDFRFVLPNLAGEVRVTRLGKTAAIKR